MPWVIDVLAILLGLVGIVGCFLPILPGPPLSYLSLVVLYFWGNETLPPHLMWICLALTLVVTVLDYLVPAWLTRVGGGTKAAASFSLAGMLVGILFFPPLGMIIGAFVGALIGERMYGEAGSFSASLRPAFFSFLGFLLGTGLKLMASGLMLIYTFKYL